MFIVILVTAKDQNEAQRIAQGLIEDKLAACCNILPKIQSLFWWDGKIDSADETLLIIKSKKALWNKLEEKVRALHSYETPEIIALPIVEGSKEYLNWIDESTVT